MSRNALELAGKLERTGTAVSLAGRDGVNEAADVMRAAVLVSLRAASGGDLKLSGVKNASVGVQVKKSTGTSNFTALVKGIPGGLVWWLEHGTKKHVIGAGRGKTGIGQTAKGRVFAAGVSKAGKDTRTFKRKLLSFGPGKGVAYGPFMGGGMRAKHAFTNGVNVVAPRAPEIVARGTRAAVSKAWR